MMLNLIEFQKKIFDDPEVPTDAQWTVKNESHFSTEKSTSFYSEFNADSEYVVLFEKYRGQKSGLIDTCPLVVIITNIR